MSRVHVYPKQSHGHLGMSITQFVVVLVALCGGLNWLKEQDWPPDLGQQEYGNLGGNCWIIAALTCANISLGFCCHP